MATIAMTAIATFWAVVRPRQKDRKLSIATTIRRSGQLDGTGPSGLGYSLAPGRRGEVV